jgi:hypothetical protein
MTATSRLSGGLCSSDRFSGRHREFDRAGHRSMMTRRSAMSKLYEALLGSIMIFQIRSTAALEGDCGQKVDLSHL